MNALVSLIGDLEAAKVAGTAEATLRAVGEFQRKEYERFKKVAEVAGIQPK